MSAEQDMAVRTSPVAPGNCPGTLVWKVADAVCERNRAVNTRSQVQLRRGLPKRQARQEVLHALEGAGGLACLGVSNGGQRGQQPRRVGGEQKPRVVDQLVKHSAFGGVGCEVGADVRRCGEPFAAAFRSDRDVPQQLSSNALMCRAGAACGAQVLGELLVVEAVHGSVLVQGLYQVEARLLEQPGDVGLRIGLIVGEHCR